MSSWSCLFASAPAQCGWSCNCRDYRLSCSPCTVCPAGVRSLDLRGCPIEDEDMANVLSALSALEVLRLPGCRKLTARAVNHLAEAGGDSRPCVLQMRIGSFLHGVAAQPCSWCGEQVRGWSLLLLGEASQSGMSHAPTLHPVLAFIGVVAVRSPLQGHEHGSEELPAQEREIERHQAGVNTAPLTGDPWVGSTEMVGHHRQVTVSLCCMLQPACAEPGKAPPAATSAQTSPLPGRAGNAGRSMRA